VTAVSIEELGKRYGNHVALSDVTFDVARGEILVLLGPNGAGKTTTVEIIVGLRSADEGSVEVLGKPPGSRDLAQRIGVMPQKGDLYAGIRAEEALRLFASFYEKPEDPTGLLEQLELDRVKRTTYRRLSGGEQRRLSLALALVGRPEVAFLDEPTAELDVEGQRRVWSIVSELRERGTTVVLTTHSLEEAERIADRVAILAHGRLVALGTPGELAGEGTGLSFHTSKPIDAKALAAALDAKIAKSGAGYRLTGPEVAPKLVSRLATWLSARGVLLTHLDAESRSLEDVYLELTL
jgi:ABC-2 type transport system ATP-binding protein